MSTTPSNRKTRVIKCPHCSTILPENSDLCCQALKDELNALAQQQGSNVFQLQTAFEKWFQAHKVEVRSAD